MWTETAKPNQTEHEPTTVSVGFFGFSLHPYPKS